MASTINGTSTGNGGLISTGDDSGILNIQTNETTAITVDASQRVAFVAGTAALPAITTTGDTNTGIWFPAADTIAFTEGGTESMRIDSSGNVLVGTTSAGGYKLNVQAGGSGAVTCFDLGAGNIDIVGGSLASGVGYIGMGGPHSLAFTRSGTTESMRIDSSGNLLVGTTSSTARFTAVKSDSSGQCVVAIDNPDAQGTGTRVSFRQNGGEQGSISSAFSGAWNINVISANSGGVRLSGGATSWSSLSDERHKDVIEPIENAISKVSTLRSVIGKYKTDEEGTRRSFLIAQDVQAVLPEAVDANDPENLGLKYTEIIPLLVASIKELKTINDTQAETLTQQTEAINALTARIVALESK